MKKIFSITALILILLPAGCAKNPNENGITSSLETSIVSNEYSWITLAEDDFGLIEVLEYDDSEKLKTLKISNEQYEFIIKMNYMNYKRGYGIKIYYYKYVDFELGWFNMDMPIPEKVRRTDYYNTFYFIFENIDTGEKLYQYCMHDIHNIYNDEDKKYPFLLSAQYSKTQNGKVVFVDYDEILLPSDSKKADKINPIDY